MNSHNLLELKFDLSDATLLGTADFLEKMPEVVSRYQVRLNNKEIQMGAMTNCTLVEKCSDIINDSKIEIVEGIEELKMSTYNDLKVDEKVVVDTYLD